ncbi:MAG TPA: glycosyltransferase family A protein [Acidimicrobiales bacterium]|nr:glycosyltransferase family A protein [Acidimicrobiales bacterium]
MPGQPLVTVLTPTFDRADLLGDTYQSLLDQSVSDVEWLVVDDGSTDDTASRVERWARDAPFDVRYLHQANAGKHVALNRGVAAARGRYVAVLDSDDRYLPGALETLLHHFESLPDEVAATFANVEARATTETGQLIGDPLPAPIVDSDNFSGHEAVRLVDTIGMYRRSVLRDHPFPEDLGRFVPEALVWNRIARRHRTRFVSDVVAVKRSQPDGLSARPTATRIGEALAYRTFYRELVSLPLPMAATSRLRGYAGYIRCSLHLGQGVLAQARDAPSRWWWLLALPLGLVAWARDRWRRRREEPR